MGAVVFSSNTRSVLATVRSCADDEFGTEAFRLRVPKVPCMCVLLIWPPSRASPVQNELGLQPCISWRRFSDVRRDIRLVGLTREAHPTLTGVATSESPTTALLGAVLYMRKTLERRYCVVLQSQGATGEAVRRVLFVILSLAAVIAIMSSCGSAKLATTPSPSPAAQSAFVGTWHDSADAMYISIVQAKPKWFDIKWVNPDNTLVNTNAIPTDTVTLHDGSNETYNLISSNLMQVHYVDTENQWQDGLFKRQ